MELLGKKAADVQVLFVTIDPERDTPEQLARHLPYYNPDFLGLTGSLEESAQVATLYGIYFEKQEGDSAADYLMDHTASVMVIVREGRLKLVLPFGVAAEDMAADLERMMR
jgi:protein SCO1